jgi:membrane protease YdiL (CAAX protease family)
MGRHSLPAEWFLSVGAGVYEELLFRFLGCGALNLLFTRGFGASKLAASTLTILVSSVLFSLYHYLGNEHFALYTFIFRTLAGGYFALVFLNRGLGISAGSHAIYDIIVVTLRGL